MLKLLLELFSGKALKLKSVAAGVWEVVGEEKLKAKMERRADWAFMPHLKRKHPEWFGYIDDVDTMGIRIPLDGDDAESPLVIFLAFFYAMRCAVKDSKCKHKG